MSLSERLRMLRKGRKSKQSDIALLLEVTPRHYQEIEYGHIDLPSSKLLLLADFYNISVDFITGRTKHIKQGGPIMEMTDIVEITQTTNVSQVNEYLKLGWQLLEIVKGIGSADMQMDPYLLYCLGWNSSKGEAIHPTPAVAPAAEQEEKAPWE